MNLNLRFGVRLRSRIKLAKSQQANLPLPSRFYATITPIPTEGMSKRKQDAKGDDNERVGSKSKSSSGPSAGDKAYAATLLLPKTEFPIWIEPSSTQEQFQHRTTEGIYKWQQENLSDPPFILHDGPPYANGNLHTGHALNKILKDSILRYRILQGQKVNYVPGWDCHGLPVENKTLERLKAEPNTLPPSTIRSAAKETAESAISMQREEMMQFGLVGDWSKEGTYRTMDNSFESRQLRIFQQMVKNGVIYRQFRPVHWSPSSKTALAEAELTYEIHTSTAAYVAFHADTESLSKDILDLLGERELKILIWTTTPWTLPTNMAICAHPEMEYLLIQREGRNGVLLCAASRLSELGAILGDHEVIGSIKGSQLENATYRPLFNDASAPTVKRPVIMGNDVLEDAGTGLVHMAPAHGHEDYQALQSQGVLRRNPLISIVDENGRYTSDVEEVWGKEAGARLVGKEVLFGGNKEVLSMLEENGSERLLKVERYRHRYPYDWRTGKPLIIRATAQWFANLDGVKQRALDALENVAFYPPAGKRRFQSFINERSEWCISRQRTWGVPIPSLHVADTGAALLDTESLDHILPILEAKGTSYWWEGPVEELMSPNTRAQYSPDQLRKGTDTMDVWFDSGTSWSLMKTGANHIPVADVYLEGSDQHRGWFQSSLLTAIASSDKQVTPQAPFKRLITHGFVLDEKGRKMSKSLGNVISPITVINGGQNIKQDPGHGTDGLRLWALSTEYAGDVIMSKLALKQTAEFLRKLRVTMRFLLGSLQDKLVESNNVPEGCSIVDRYVLHELWTLERDSRKAYEDFSSQQVVAGLTRFVNTTLSSLYFDVSKDVLYADPEASKSRLNILYVLSSVLETMTPIIAPLVPYLAEEVHDVLERSRKPNDPVNSVLTRGWKTANDKWKNEQAKEDMSALLEIRHAVNSLLEKARTEKKIRSSLEATVRLTLPSNMQTSLLHSHGEFLRHLFIVSNVELQSEAGAVQQPENDWSHSEQLSWKDTNITVTVEPPSRQKCPRCWSYTREADKTLCGRCDDALETTKA